MTGIAPGDLDISAEDFWECPRTHCKMLKSNRAEFCAKRKERAKEWDLCFACSGKPMSTYKNKLCTRCKKSKQAKDDLCYKCYKDKHGVAPFPSQKKWDKKSTAKPVEVQPEVYMEQKTHPSHLSDTSHDPMKENP
jgi:hypothetical protein